MENSLLLSFFLTFQIVTQGNTDSPMPELLSLKDRLKLFEKEIEQQASGPPAEAKKDRKFSFLSEDELRRMKAGLEETRV